MLRKVFASFALLGVVALAVASSGGGGSKKRSSVASAFSPATSTAFTLKSGPQFLRSQIFSTQKSQGFVMFNTIVTYQRGNTTYLLPYSYKMSTKKPCMKSNLNIVDLRINLKK